MSTMTDKELNKAALVIAKLLILTRKGKIKWTTSPATAGQMPALADLLGGRVQWTTQLENDVQAIIFKDTNSIGFALAQAVNHLSLSNPIPLNTPGAGFQPEREEILSTTLSHSFKNDDDTSPESIVYRDLDELLYLAQNPKSVEDDRQYNQVLSYLDRLAG